MKKLVILLVSFYTGLNVSAQSLDSLVSLDGVVLGPFCPKRLVAGDRDFSGRGPEVWANVKIVFNKVSVMASLTYKAKELKGGDNSEVNGTTLKILYNPPRDYDIVDVTGGKSAEVHFTSKSSVTTFNSGALSKVLNVNATTPGFLDKNDGLVKSWEIVGDTNGPDISDDDNCDDDARIKVLLNSLKIKLRKTSAAQGLRTIVLEDINEWLCPSKLVRGDREFDGHGPRIKSEVKLRIAAGGTQLMADITLWAKETVHDWSETEGKWSKLVYEVPYGKKITEIISNKASRTQFMSPPGGFQFLVPGQDVARALYTFFDATDVQSGVLAAFGAKPEERSVLTALVKGTLDNGNTVVRVPPVEGALVKFFHIVGDTGGNDISGDDNCNDDTRITKIEFFPVRVKMVDAK
jgi:hypothetical protein